MRIRMVIPGGPWLEWHRGADGCSASGNRAYEEPTPGRFGPLAHGGHSPSPAGRRRRIEPLAVVRDPKHQLAALFLQTHDDLLGGSVLSRVVEGLLGDPEERHRGFRPQPCSSLAGLNADTDAGALRILLPVPG